MKDAAEGKETCCGQALIQQDKEDTLSWLIFFFRFPV